MKNSRFIYNAVAVLVVGILLNACIKPTYSYEYIDQETKDFCVFGKGSYWIYQDSITNNLDSVMLMQSLLKTVEDHGEWGHTEIIECYESEYCHYLSDTSIFFSHYIDSHKGTYFSIIDFGSGIQDIEKNVALCIPIGRSSIGYYLLSYGIGENIFSNVNVLVEKKIIIDGFASHYSIQSYWVKNIGLIRYEIYNPDNEILNTYNLIKYNVKPYKK